jgi:hypothetical protein
VDELGVEVELQNAGGVALNGQVEDDVEAADDHCWVGREELLGSHA